MKTLIISILLSLLCSCGYPQKITGKWDCDKEVMQALRIDYKEVYCTYKFKKNGTLIIKIDGETMIDHSSTSIQKEMGSIRIKGRYVLHNGQLTSFVDDKEIEVATTDILDNKQLFKGHDRLATYVNDIYKCQDECAKTMEQELLQKILEHRYLWDWDNEPVTITKKELIIGDKLRCKR